MILKRLPVLKKDILKNKMRNLYLQNQIIYNSYSFKTSGSTGTPLKGKIFLNDLREGL